MKPQNVELSGEVIVRVNNAVVMDVTEVPEEAESAPVLFAKGGEVYEVVYNPSDLHAVERVHVDSDMVDAFINIMYMTQRSSSTTEWENLPTPTADVYDALVFLQAKIRAENGREAYQSELNEMKDEERFTNDLPEWAEL